MTARAHPIVAAAALLLGLVAAPTPARAQLDDRDLIYAGLAMAVPTYVLGVVAHEGSHAVAGTLVGAELVSISFLPGRDPKTGAFHFGLTRVRGLRGDGRRAFFLAAPKLTDLVLLGGYGALVAADAWPEHRYGRLALTVLATGFWVDFAKDVISFREVNDVVKLMTLAGWKSEWRRLPSRLLYAGASVGLGYLVWKGFDKTFADEVTATARPSPGADDGVVMIHVGGGRF
ncbi:MAG: hypothetical protein KBG28_27080 [Kofleriaceae bacterium]|nr:hypothetical protein [Kofleriaceae bacterium]MBP6841567.1 hypothetical protein [Kofleriaceae bacterium]MBP9207659.1 hypothetical protein [Kofleriaceae bacterium]